MTRLKHSSGPILLAEHRVHLSARSSLVLRLEQDAGGHVTVTMRRQMGVEPVRLVLRLSPHVLPLLMRALDRLRQRAGVSP